MLIIEDNSFIGKNLINASKKINTINRISIATSLKEANLLLNDSDFDIIILDLKLPDGNGIKILKELKEKNKKTKVFVFSISKELKQLCLKYGALAFYDKSKDFDKLIGAIKKVK